MKAASAAAPAAQTKAAAEAKAATATTAASSLSLSLLQYGASLYEAHTHLPEAAVARLPLNRYADYLRHFGFSMERESRGAAAPGTTLALDCTSPNHKTQAPLDGRWGKRVETDTSYDPVEVAGWGLPEALRCEADQQCNAVGSLSDATEWSAIAKQLVHPFMSVTWRQTATQCTMKKACCVYMWLCSHMTLQVSVPGAEEDAKEDSGGVSTVGLPSAAKAASLARKANRPARKVKEVPTTLEPAAPPDPLLVALQTRRAPAPVLADVYMHMLTSVGVLCEVVVGQLKGAAPEEAFEWSWNMVTVDGRQYLVDVSAALSNGVLRSAASYSDVPSSVAVPEAGKGQRAGNAAGRGKAATPSQSSPPAGSGAVPCSESVQLLPVTPERLRREFFFFAHPTYFLASHFPADPAKALVRTAMRAVQWGVRPRLTPAFYYYGLQLASHKTHSTFAASGSPSYVSFVNHHASTTELCCALYMGTLGTLPEDLSQTAPLGAEWVWHQREESTSTDTFTLTVPQAGYYVVVIGARPIRADPYSAVFTVAGETAFTPVVSYEMRVGFTPSSSPVLPRQYLSPSICRLITPLCSQILPGKHTFCVMPSCSNVLAVAVVKFVAAAATRTLLSLLPFQPRSAAFEGDVDVRSGECVEVWVLYGAPDRNGQELSQRAAAAAPPKAAATPCRSPTPAAKFKAADKKKREASAEHQQQLSALESQLAHLTQALHKGEVFQRCVGGIEVRHFVSPAVVGVIQPQPMVEQEQSITLRRLAGVTDALLREAEEVVRRQPAPVGSYFGAVEAAAAKS
ncbi:conserved hypothetical protein [Leishmania major strain Friedlin]|uniref:Uncharacterized protein n=1 Tax=Leishmania major TaxID=5664 RepID=Q4QFH3_LEIMA|nr:conserved hypothetical protein [Leishmania major strain Friedlin]CAG9571356.1 hypothetical_protein_-_conserved [Leishmania major strain Friedlin]CAJ03235.1 conserved hypothetical protein [Leishmania major strain Friedlin]|eukprot:XP_001681925.1 conserved hypothetical protein [Leishmania major strain Friedlin]